MNSREKLEQVAEWLGWQDESLSSGLRNAFDALRLHDYAMAHPDLPEMADEWEPVKLIEALGYDPLDGDVCHEAEGTGAATAADAMRQARELIDSVTYVSKEGDKEKPMAAIDAVIGH